jgi:DHA1 family inner membrane transport protein
MLNQGALNLGNAAGAFAGELALTHGLSYANIPWIGAGLAGAGLAVALVSYRLDRSGGIHSAAGMRQTPAQMPIQMTAYRRNANV